MVQLSLDGKYLAKGYSDLEYDLATVVYELGGSHCLTALQKSPFAFPSRNALFERRREYKLKSDHAKFREKFTISPVEEERLGIPDDLVGLSVMRHLNYDAARMDRLPTVRDLHGESPRRACHTYNPAPVPFALPAYVHYHSYVQPQADVFR